MKSNNTKVCWKDVLNKKEFEDALNKNPEMSSGQSLWLQQRFLGTNLQFSTKEEGRPGYEFLAFGKLYIFTLSSRDHPQGEVSNKVQKVPSRSRASW